MIIKNITTSTKSVKNNKKWTAGFKSIILDLAKHGVLIKHIHLNFYVSSCLLKLNMMITDF